MGRIVFYCGEKSYCWVGNPRLSADTGISDSSITRTLQKAEADGLIRLEYVGRRRYIYLLDAATLPEKVAVKRKKKEQKKNSVSEHAVTFTLDDIGDFARKLAASKEDQKTENTVFEHDSSLIDDDEWDDPFAGEHPTGTGALHFTHLDLNSGVEYGPPREPQSTPEPSHTPKLPTVDPSPQSTPEGHREPQKQKPDNKLVAKLEQAGVWPKDARRLAAQHPESAVDHWIEQAQLWGEGLTNPGGWIRTALDKPWKLPDWVLEPERLQERLAEAVWSSASPEDKYKILAEAKSENGEVCRLAREISRMVPTWKPGMEATAAIDYLLRTRVNR